MIWRHKTLIQRRWLRKVKGKIQIPSEEKWLGVLAMFNLEKKRLWGDIASSKHLKHKKKNWVNWMASGVRVESNA